MQTPSESPSFRAFDAMSDAVLVLDRQGAVRYANRAAALLLGAASQSAHQALDGTSYSQLVPVRYRARLSRQLERVFDQAPSGERFDKPQTLQALRRDGHECAVEVAWSWLTSQQPLLLGVARRAGRGRREQRASASAGRLHLQLDCAAVSLVQLNQAGVITHVNEAWRRFARDNDADPATQRGIGLDYLAVSRTDGGPVAAAVVAGIEALLAGQREQFEIDYSCHSPTQLRWFRLVAQRPASVGSGAVLTHIDITEQHKAEAHSRLHACVSDAYASRKPLLDACRELAQVACQELEWDFMSTWVLDTPSWTLHCVDVWSRAGQQFPAFVRANYAAKLAPGVGLPGRAWLTRKALWATAADLDQAAAGDDQRARSVLPPVALSAGFRSGFAFAVKYDDDVLAVIEVFGRLEQGVDPPLLRLLEVAGEQLGTAELRERAERRAEAAQAEADAAREELEAVLECVPALVVAIDRNGAVRFVNKYSGGRTREGLVGAPWRQCIPEDSHALVEQALATVLEGGQPQTFEVTSHGPDRRARWTTNFMGPIRRGATITGALLLTQDVTETKTAQQELFAAQRLAAIGTLAAGIAHEINTPVQFLGDNIEFLSETSEQLFSVLELHQALRALVASNDNAAGSLSAAQAAKDAEEQADLEYLRIEVPKAFEGCREGLQRVSSIVRSMKEFSHPADLEMVPVELNRAIEATLTVARSEYKYVADLETDLGELPAVTCYVNDINQVVLNIVVNAAHAIADKVAGTGRRGTIRVSTRRDGSDVVIAISDNGPGIPVAIRERIFEPFFTTKEVGRGTGQGLALAWSAVKEKHAGELTFDTRLGEGTTFFIRLPICGANAAARSPARPAGSRSS